jgi:hypothetical protein
MWDLLNKTEIERAKQELKLRHAETLRRQAVENQNLDAERLESETLYRLVDTFVQKFMKPPIVSHAPIAIPVSHQPVSHQPVSHQPVSHQNVGAKTSHEARHHQHHRDQPRDQRQDQPQTVFATFVRAQSRHH